MPNEVTEALQDARDALALAADTSLCDPYILVELGELCDRVGYGNVMSSASSLWRQKLGDLAGGEFVAGPCRTTVEKALQKIDAAMRAADTPPVEADKATTIIMVLVDALRSAGTLTPAQQLAFDAGRDFLSEGSSRD